MRRNAVPFLSSWAMIALLVLLPVMASAASHLENLRIHPLPTRFGAALQAESTPDGNPPAVSFQDTISSLRQLLARHSGAPLDRNAPLRSVRRHSGISNPEFPGQITLKTGAMTPRQIVMPTRDGPQGRSVTRALDSREYHLEMAGDFLYVYRDVLRLDDPDREKRLVKYFQDNTGRTHVRYAQHFKDIPVWPAQWQVSLTPDGRVERFSGAYVPTPKRLVLAPTIDRFQALETAFRAIADAGLRVADPAAVGLDEELIIFAPGGRPATLAWKVTLHLTLDQVWRVLVDAHANVVLDAYNTVPGASVTVSGAGTLGDRIAEVGWAESGAYFLVDKSKPMYNPARDTGNIITLDLRNQQEGDLFLHSAALPTGPWVPDGLSLHRNMSQTYDYFLARHAWNSFDNNGHDIRGITRVGQGHYNAFWNSHQKLMGYGDARPFAADLTVVAHEFTHGITSSTSNLVYRDQSGSANEAMSDIFGVAADAWAKGEINWLVGYIAEADAEGGGMRSLRDPGSIRISSKYDYVYPRRMSEYLDRSHPLWEMLGFDDYGGVHINNMIVGHAFYLMAEGLPGAIGLEKAADIFFRANTVYLLSNSQFVDVRLACMASAEELFGRSSREAQVVAQAFDQVEILDPHASGDPGTSTGPSPAPYVPGPDNVIFVQYGADLLLARREAALGDPAQGVPLSVAPVSMIRPSVSRDGELACYVTSDNDVACQQTDGEGATESMGLAGQVYSVALSPDAMRFAFVFLEDGQPSNTIVIFDLGTNEITEYPLLVHVLDAEPLDWIQFAESMTFTSDSRFLFYDAFSVIDVSDRDPFGAWAIYVLDLQTGENVILASGNQGVQIYNPALANTTDDVLVMDVYNPASNINEVVAVNLVSRGIALVGQVQGLAAFPDFIGNDRSIVFSSPNEEVPTGTMLIMQQVAADRITPQGGPEVYLQNGYAGVVYRRGVSDSPQPRVTLGRSALAFGEVFVGRSSAQDLTITNGGFGNLEIMGLSVAGVDSRVYSMAGSCPGRHLAQEESCTMRIQFAPEDEGERSAIVTVRTNDPELPSAQASLTGLGVFDQSTFTNGQWITSFYAAYFSRIPDAQGHGYWMNQFNQGQLTIAQIAENFALQDEAKDAYPYFTAPESATPAQINDFVRSVYSNLLNRAVPADDPGVAYWVNELRTGRSTPGALIGNIIFAAMQGQGADWRTLWDTVRQAGQNMR